MTTVQQLLNKKSHEIFFVGPNDTVEDALRMMEKENIGAVMVKDNDNLIGIFTERHYARNVFLKGRRSPDTPIKEVMKTDILYVEPDLTIEDSMAIMSQNRVRHLPVLAGGQLVGVISIGDIMRSMISVHEFNIDQMIKYVQGVR